MPTVTITRAKLYATPGRSCRFAWKWTYQYQIGDGAPIGYGDHLASLRGMLRRKFRGEKLTVIEVWKQVPQPGCTGMRAAEPQ